MTMKLFNMGIYGAEFNISLASIGRILQYTICAYKTTPLPMSTVDVSP